MLAYLKWIASSKNSSFLNRFFNMECLGCQWTLLIYEKVVTITPVETHKRGHHHCCLHSLTATSHRWPHLVETSIGNVGAGPTLRPLLEFSTLAAQGDIWKQAHGHEDCHSTLVQGLGIKLQVRKECRELLEFSPVPLDPEIRSFFVSCVYRIVDYLLCVWKFQTLSG